MNEEVPEQHGSGPHHRRRSQAGMRHARRIVNRLILPIVLVLIALVGFGHVKGYESLVVLSGSMGKTAPVGSLVVGKPMQARQIKVGTIVLMRENGQMPILHRVVQREDAGGGAVLVHTKGDANPAPDPFTTTLHGTVVTPILVFPELGYVLSWFQTPAGWAALVLAPLLLVGLSALRRRWTSLPGAPSRRQGGARSDPPVRQATGGLQHGRRR